MALVYKDIPLDRLTPHPSNPRRGDVAAIAESLRVNGQYRPIVVSKDHVVLAGNHTYLAAASLGMKSISCVVLTITSDSAEATRVMLADNRTAELGGYSDTALLDLLRQLDGDLDGTGFNIEDVLVLDELLARGRADPMTEEEWEGLLDEEGTVTLAIHGLTTGEVSTFRAVEGESDADRLRRLMGA